MEITRIFKWNGMDLSQFKDPYVGSSLASSYSIDVIDEYGISWIEISATSISSYYNYLILPINVAAAPVNGAIVADTISVNSYNNSTWNGGLVARCTSFASHYRSIPSGNAGATIVQKVQPKAPYGEEDYDVDTLPNAFGSRTASPGGDTARQKHGMRIGLGVEEQIVYNISGRQIGFPDWGLGPPLMSGDFGLHFTGNSGTYVRIRYRNICAFEYAG